MMTWPVFAVVCIALHVAAGQTAGDGGGADGASAQPGASPLLRNLADLEKTCEKFKTGGGGRARRAPAAPEGDVEGDAEGGGGVRERSVPPATAHVAAPARAGLSFTKCVRAML